MKKIILFLILLSLQMAYSNVVHIGDSESDTSVSMPFNFYWENNVSQALYYEDELSFNGLITHIGFNFFGAGDVPSNLQYSLYLATTHQMQFTSVSDFIPLEFFTLVYEGELPFSESGNRYVTIELTTPFPYSEGNLAVMAHKKWSNFSSWENNTFRSTATPGSQRVLDIRDSNDIGIPPSNTQWHSILPFIPNIEITYTTSGLGTISGVVSSSSGTLEGVEIRLNDSAQYTFSNSLGEFTIPFIEPGTVFITARLHGYEDKTITDINITADTVTNVDIFMETINTVNITGTVLASDTSAALSGAVVSLQGYHNYLNYTTNEAGNFFIPDVFTDQVYKITISKQGYDTYVNDSFYVTNETNDIGQITLYETANPPWRVVAFDDGNFVSLFWNEPTIADNKWFTHTVSDDWEIAWGYLHMPFEATAMQRFTAEQLNDLGVAGADLTKIAIFAGFGDGAVFNLKVYTGGSSEPYHPGILVHSQPVIPDLETWTEFILSTPVQIPIDEELWIGYHVTAPAGSFPAATTDIGSAFNGFGNLVDWGDGVWTTILDSRFEDENWMIKGYAEGCEIISFYNRNSPLPPSERGVISTLHEGGRGELRVLTGYDIYRFNVLNQSDESQWTLLSSNHQGTFLQDNEWGSLPTNTAFQYAVKAVYTNNNISSPAFSNILGRHMYSEVTIKLNTDDNGSTAGATVQLSNNNGNLEQVYQGVIIDDSIVFPSVWLGIYTLTITHENYVDLIIFDLDINANHIAHTFSLIGKIVILQEGFEDTEFPPLGWLLIDADNDDYNWKRAINEDGYAAYSGEALAFSESWTHEGSVNGVSLNPDNYLITPLISLWHTITQTSKLEWYITTWDPQYPIETYSIMISTTTPTVEAFTDTLFTETINNARKWEKRSIDISAYENQEIYIGFRHHQSYDNFQIVLDEIEIYSSKAVTSVKDESGKPISNLLVSNYPNPFNASTIITFENAVPGIVNVDIFNIRGQKIKTLTNEHYESGRHSVEWEGKDEQGRNVSSGVYFYRMSTEGFSKVRRMVLMK